MFDIIHASLLRQGKGLELLSSLLDEEYQHLLKHDTDAIAAVEFSIQELLRQLAVEKLTVVRLLEGVRVMEFAATLPQEEGNALTQAYLHVDTTEQQSARLASRNAQLSLALLDQSSRNLNTLTSQIVPKKPENYAPRNRNRYGVSHPEAALISRRF